jgi:hypothetical protein
MVLAGFSLFPIGQLKVMYAFKVLKVQYLKVEFPRSEIIFRNLRSTEIKHTFSHFVKFYF